MCWARGANSISAFHALQPSEFLKPGFAILAAAVLADRQPMPLAQAGDHFCCWSCRAVVILLLQPDVGQTGLLLSLWGAMLFFCGPAAFLGGPAGWASPAVLGFAAYAIFPHVHHRVDQFSASPIPAIRQAWRSKAFAHGGLTGVGPGAGTIKYRIPDAHSDFIFAVAGEEFGLMLCGVIAASVLRLLTVRLLLRAADAARSLLPTGGRGPCRGHGGAGLHQYGRGGVAAARQGHDPALHLLWRLVAVRRGADHGLRAGGDAPAAQARARGPSPLLGALGAQA